MRILIADKLASQVVECFHSLGCTVRSDPALGGDSLVEAIQDFEPEVLVVRSTRVGAQHFGSATKLSLVIRAGAGVNTIDLDAASRLGIFVANCPGKNAIAVAELAMGHILNADRRISDNVAALRAGEWKKKQFTKGCRGIKGRTLGIVGMGNIGQEMLTRARAFGMNILGYDPFLPKSIAADLQIEMVDDLVEMANRIDVLSIHVGLNEKTRGMISGEVLRAMPEGSIVINTSRGPIIDEKELQFAVQERGFLAGLDVFCDEPSSDGSWNKPITQLSGVYGTHHIGASTTQASNAVGDEVLSIVESYMNTGTVPNCVNIALRSPATHMLVVRHADQVGVLAKVLDNLREAKVNVQEMENIIFSGATAACARIRIDHSPPEIALTKIRSISAVHALSLVSLETS